MATEIMKYNLDNINNIIFEGFNYVIPEETIKIINDLASQVGSPNYVKTPNFNKNREIDKENKKENYLNSKNKRKNIVASGNKFNETINEDWEILRNFQTTKLETKKGLDVEIDLIRGLINKITDKNTEEITLKIMVILNKILNDENIENSKNPEILKKISNEIFDILSNNKYYSKIYSDLYTKLINDFSFLNLDCIEKLNKFIELCNNIQYIDPNKDYDKFCEINKINEKRKSLASFYLNLMYNNVIPKDEIKKISRNLLNTIYNYIKIENKKNEVDELVEIIAILYKKDLYENDDEEEYENLNYELIEGYTISEIIEKISQSKVKDYKSLTNKSLFKFMDLMEL